MAHAQGGDAAARLAAREHYQKGSVAYELGHYDTAIAEYERAYQAFNEPTLLYNLGQAHRLAKHLPEALHFYKMYLIKLSDAPNRADVETRIAALQKAIAQTAQTVAPAPPTAQPVPAPAPPPKIVTAAPTPVVAHPADRKRTLEVAGLVVGVVGLGLIGGGVGMGLLAKTAGDDISRADANHQPYEPAKYSTYQNDRIASGVLLGVGAAAVITGTTMGIIGLRRGRHPIAMQLSPQLSPGHAGLNANIRF